MIVSQEMTKVIAHILDAPLLVLGNHKPMTSSNDKRQWKMTSGSDVFQGKSINSWGIIHFSENPNRHNELVQNFINEMVKSFNKVGIYIEANNGIAVNGTVFAYGVKSRDLNEEYSASAHTNHQSTPVNVSQWLKSTHESTKPQGGVIPNGLQYKTYTVTDNLDERTLLSMGVRDLTNAFLCSFRQVVDGERSSIVAPSMDDELDRANESACIEATGSCVIFWLGVLAESLVTWLKPLPYACNNSYGRHENSDSESYSRALVHLTTGEDIIDFGRNTMIVPKLELFVGIIESASLLMVFEKDDMSSIFLSEGSTDDLKDSFQDEGFILEPVKDFFNVLDILATGVNRNAIKSGMLWRRLIRSVCEKKITKLKSSRLVVI